MRGVGLLTALSECVDFMEGAALWAVEAHMLDGLILLVDFGILLLLISFRSRDFYVVVREFRIVAPDDFGKGKAIESSFATGPAAPI